MLEITDTAKSYWSNLLAQKPGAKYVRLSIKGGGCAGFAYEWQYTDNDDRGTLVDDIVVVGSRVDFVENLGGSHIELTNPNEASACGCGESIQFVDAVIG
jgi:iron-sulfur cluster assembly accessory protein